MADNAHNVGLTALLINRVFHSFTVNGKAFVVLSVRFMPLLQSQIELLRFPLRQNSCRLKFLIKEFEISNENI